MLTLKKFKETGYFLKNKNDFNITFERQYNQYSVICIKDNSKSKAFKTLTTAVDYFLKLIEDKEIAIRKEFYDWYNSQPTPPTADEMNNYWKEKDKDKPKEEEKKINFSYDLDDNYKQGLGNGNYTLEEYVYYELEQNDIR